MKEVAKNRRAYYDYEILDKIEAGINLTGFEVKAAKSGKISLGGSYARTIDGDVYLVGADIEPYQPNNTPEGYEGQRDRRLLLTKKEIASLSGKIKESGLTLVPLRAYIKGRLVKVELGLAKSKKKQDKREAIKKRDVQRDIRRTLKPNK